MNTESILQPIRQAVIDGDDTAAAESAAAALASGVDPTHILNAGLMASAQEVGWRFEEGEFFLPDLMLAGRALKAAMDVLKPALQGQYASGESQVGGSAARIVIATIQTDIHDLGKNMVASMLMASGFDVTDLGVDVPMKTIIDKAEEIKADVIAVSALLTTSMPYLKDLIDLLQARNLRQKYIVIVGGASVTPEWARSIGADGTARNAVDAIRLVRTLLGHAAGMAAGTE
jgi:corrinoid protein of di/trimethylamine methyltransferase